MFSLLFIHFSPSKPLSQKHRKARIYAICFCLLLGLSGCGGGSDSAGVTPEPTPPTTDTPPTPTAPAPAPTPPDSAEEILPVLPPAESSNEEFEGTVNVTFSVTVPDNTPPEARLYITGDFEGWSGGGNNDFELMLQDNNVYELSVPLDAGSTIQFKITRGSWTVEESSDLGRFVGNRVRHLRGDDVTLNETVSGWLDLIDSSSNPFSGYWNTATPDYSTNSQRPVVSLVGNHVVYLNVGGNYVEQGATALDPDDGDISANISTIGAVNTQVSGDYLLSYNVIDSDNNSSLGATRIIRVIDSNINSNADAENNNDAENKGLATAVTMRPVGQSLSHLGYAEQLPADYGTDPGKKYPLIIYHHGGGGDAASIDDSPMGSLLQLFTIGGGTASIAMQGDWNTASPLIALSPQRSSLTPLNMARINAFVDYAIHHYQVDPNRIYMTGHSQGGFASWRYAVEFPNKVAAIAPLAGGFFAGGIPGNICDAAVVPVWAFHSIDDNTVRASTGRAPIERIENCGPPQPTRFTTFDGLGHQSHQYVLSLQGMGNALGSDFPFEQNLYEWLMQQDVSLRP